MPFVAVFFNIQAQSSGEFALNAEDSAKIETITQTYCNCINEGFKEIDPLFQEYVKIIVHNGVAAGDDFLMDRLDEMEIQQQEKIIADAEKMEKLDNCASGERENFLSGYDEKVFDDIMLAYVKTLENCELTHLLYLMSLVMEESDLNKN